MLKDYLPILIQAVVAIGFAASALIVSVVLGKAGKRNATKDSAYECGMLPEGGAQPRFSVKFYLVAMLFILFDIEIVFMYPWAVVYRITWRNPMAAASFSGACSALWASSRWAISTPLKKALWTGKNNSVHSTVEFRRSGGFFLQTR